MDNWYSARYLKVLEDLASVKKSIAENEMKAIRLVGDKKQYKQLHDEYKDLTQKKIALLKVSEQLFKDVTYASMVHSDLNDPRSYYLNTYAKPGWEDAVGAFVVSGNKVRLDLKGQPTQFVEFPADKRPDNADLFAVNLRKAEYLIHTGIESDLVDGSLTGSSFVVKLKPATPPSLTSDAVNAVMTSFLGENPSINLNRKQKRLMVEYLKGNCPRTKLVHSVGVIAAEKLDRELHRYNFTSSSMKLIDPATAVGGVSLRSIGGIVVPFAGTLETPQGWNAQAFDGVAVISMSDLRQVRVADLE